MSLAHIAFLTVCIVWGTTYLGIAVALETVPVLLVAGLRWMFAGVVMCALMMLTVCRSTGVCLQGVYRCKPLWD